MQDNNITIKGLSVWIICAVFFLYEFLLRTVVGTFQPPLMQDLNLTSFQFSLLSSTIFSLIYGVMQIPAGIIVDNLGLKKSLLIATTVCCVAVFGFAYSYNFPLAVLYRFLMGFGASFGFICLLIAVSDWLPVKFRALFIGLSQFIGTMGPMLAAGPLESFAASGAIDWRLVFLSLAVFGLLLVVLVFFFVENNQEKTGNYTVLFRPANNSTIVKKLFARAEPWFVAILSAGLYFSLEYLSENEGRAYLQLKGLSINAAGYMLTVAWLGYAISCPLLGLISDLIERRKIILVISAILGLLAILSILYAPTNLTAYAFFLLGFSAGGQSVGFAIMAEQFKKQFMAVGFGLNNAVIMIVAAINAPAIGIVLDNIKQKSVLTIDNYNYTFLVLVAISVASVIIAFKFINETFCKSRATFTLLETGK